MSLNRKARRHNGRATPRLVIKGKYKDIIEQGLEPQVYWDDWKDYRDGQRGSKDRTLIRSRHSRIARYFNVNYWNEKLKKLTLRRKLRRLKRTIRLG